MKKISVFRGLECAFHWFFSCYCFFFLPITMAFNETHFTLIALNDETKIKKRVKPRLKYTGKPNEAIAKWFSLNITRYAFSYLVYNKFVHIWSESGFGIEFQLVTMNIVLAIEYMLPFLAKATYLAEYSWNTFWECIHHLSDKYKYFNIIYWFMFRFSV